MKHLKLLVIATLIMLAVSACSRMESSQIDMGHFHGAWQEYFGPGYRVEGSRTWYISDEIIRVVTYDWYSDTTWEWNIDYSLDQKSGKYMVFLHYPESLGKEDESYDIVKLTDEEMIWHYAGLSEDATRHFVNSKYWQTHDE